MQRSEWQPSDHNGARVARSPELVACWASTCMYGLPRVHSLSRAHRPDIVGVWRVDLSNDEPLQAGQGASAQDARERREPVRHLMTPQAELLQARRATALQSLGQRGEPRAPKWIVPDEGGN